MKAEEKQVLYSFFKTASDYFSGYKSYEKIPEFTDDTEVISFTEESCQDKNGSGLFSVKPVSEECTANETFLISEELNRIAEAVSLCTGCGLCSFRKNVVPGEGPYNFSNFQNIIDVMVIGEGPGADEDVQGRPFVGKAGQLLDKMLSAIDLFRDRNCFIANIVKCRPPNNRDPLPEESNACRKFLEAQITAIKPKAILAVGRVALQNLLDTKEGITKLHGKFLEYKGIPFMATYHPSALLRDVNLKRPAWEDLKLFRSKLEELIR